MEDHLKLNELVRTTKTEIIPSRLNKTIKAHTSLVPMETSMNMMTEPLHQNDKALPQGLHVYPSYSTYNSGSQKTVQLYNSKDHTIVIKKGTAVMRMMAANEVPKMLVANGAVGAL